MEILYDWLTMIARWWHLVAGIAWVGTSFYFNWLDSLFRQPMENTMRENNRGVVNETHGGNFYYHEQYFPDHKPPGLHAHSWPAKMTLLSGLTLLVLIYWLGASSYMIDKNVADITPWMAIAISAGSIVVCWLIYHNLVQRVADNRIILAVMAVIAVLAAYGFQQVFGGRAAWISVGVMFGSVMGLNVWLVIAKNSIAMQKQLAAGGGYNRDNGFIAKRRSQHNNYFTLPVLVTMVSNHFALAYNHKYAWLILILLMFVGWSIRHVLNVFYKKDQYVPLLYVAIVVALAAAMGLTLSSTLGTAAASNEKVVSDQALMSIIETRCTACHATKPTQAGFVAPPQGLVLENIAEVRAAMPKIRQRVLVARDMPLANLTQMTDSERADVAVAFSRLEKN